jgi:hypothetical protein
MLGGVQAQRTPSAPDVEQPPVRSLIETELEADAVQLGALRLLERVDPVRCVPITARVRHRRVEISW